jgi:phosphatidylglycerophosphate synthase
MKYSKQTLRAVYWKSCSHEGYGNILIYRPLALLFTVLFAKLRATPNQVTVLSFVFSAASAVLFALGEYNYALLALIPFHIGKILDCSDGQLATLTNQKSKLGAFLDPFLDRVIDSLTMGALAVGYYAHTGSAWAMYLFMALVSVWFVGAYLDKYSQEGARNLDNLRQTTGFLPPALRRLAKWDGGFTGLVVTLAVVFWQQPALMALCLAFAVLPLPISFMKIIRSLR